MNVITEDDLEVVGVCTVWENAQDRLREMRDAGDSVMADPFRHYDATALADTVVGFEESQKRP